MIKIKRFNLLFASFLILHVFRLQSFVLIPTVIFYLHSIVNKMYRYKAALFLYLYAIYATIIFFSSIYPSITTAALIDFKPIFMLSIFPSFILFDKIYSPKLEDIAKIIIYSILIIMISSVIFKFNYMNIIIRGDIGLIAMVALVLILPMSIDDLKRYIFVFFMLFLSFLLIQGRASMLAGAIAIGFLLLKSHNYRLIEKKIYKYYFVLGIIFLFLVGLVFITRAVDISNNYGVSVAESEARFLAFVVFYDVLSSFSLFEWLFGRGFGIDFSENIDCGRVLPLVCLHMENIIIGNNGIYPAVGFHNELIRIFVSTGLIGTFIFFFFVRSLWRKKISNIASKTNQLYAIRLNSLIVLFLISLFSHGILGSTITSFVILSSMGIIYSKSINKYV